MTTGTSFLKFETLTKYCGLLLFVCATKLMAQTVPLASNSALSGQPTGVVRDLEVIGDSIYLAAENGLYKITGSKAEVITLPIRPQQKRGIISDLTKGNDNTLYISEFGVGVFAYDYKTGTIEQLSISSDMAKYAWRMAYSQNHLYVAAITGFFIFEASTNTLIDAVSSDGNRKFQKLYNVAMLEDGVALFAEKERFIRYDVKNSSSEIKSYSQDYPKLSKITALYKSDMLYVGGPEGVYSTGPEEERPVFYPYENKPEKKRKLRNIFAQKNGEIWVAAEELYQLSKSRKRIIQPPFLNPMLNSYAINTVIDVDETSSGELLVVSTQQGLLVLPPAYQGIHFLHNGNNYFHSGSVSVYESVTIENDAFSKPILVTSTDQYQINVASGSLDSSGVIEAPPGSPSQRACWAILDELSLGEEIKNKCWNDGAHLTQYSTDKYLLYEQTEAKGSYLVLKDNQSVDSISAPQKLVSTLHLNSGALVALDEHGRLHIQMSRFNWKLIPTEDIGSYIVNCMIEWKTDILWLCTSGNGVVEVNLQTNQISTLSDRGVAELRFVRAGVKDSQGNVWLATNKGLVVHNPDSQTTYMLGAEDGIVDIDFHYEGMYLIDDSLILMGDKYAYLLDTPVILKSLEQQAKKEYSVKFLSFRAGASSDDGVKLAEAKNRERIRLEAGAEPVSVIIAPTNYTFRNRQRVEYRVKGIIDEWQQSENSTATLTFSDLETRYYTIEARIVDPRSKAAQPISSIYLFVQPPFYLTWQAYLFYSLLLLCFGLHTHKRYQTTLRNQVSQYSAQVYEQKAELASSQKSIRHLVDAKQRLFTNISHEIKTPLALIVGVLRNIAFDKEDEKQVSQRSIVFRNAERVECLVGQLVEIEKLDSVRKLPRTQYNLGATANAIVQSFAGLIEQKVLDVDVKMSGKRNAYLLEDSLEKILSNLLGNAIKYTSDEGRILISIANQDTGVKIRVKDNGIGIGDEHKKTIFERFTRIEEVDGVKGVGVGLALINEIAKANNGWIEVQSEHGKGSCFTVHLPQEPLSIPGYLNAQPEEQLYVPERTEIVPEEIDHSGRHRILIVEDDRDYRTYLYDMLSKHYSCFTARNGRSAKDVFRTIQPQLVVTDYRMPDIDGLAFARFIRTKSEHPQTPIILLTAHTSNETQKQRFATSVDCMLSKSLMDHELVAHIDNLISLREITEQHLIQRFNESPPPGHVKEPIPHFTNEKDQVFYTSLLATMERCYSDVSFNRAAAAKALNMSERQLNRRMAALFEYNFAEYLKRFRVQKAKILLCRGRQVTATAMDVGFCTASYFSNCFKIVTGLPPSAYQEANRNAEEADPNTGSGA